MDYTTDPTEAVNDLLDQHYLDATLFVANSAIDEARIKFCVDVREASGKPPDPTLTQAAIDLSESITATNAKIDQLSRRVPAPDPTRVAFIRAEWLAAYIASVESEHAQHGVLIELATELGDDDQVAQSTVAQIVCEGAHVAAVEQLRSIGRQNGSVAAHIDATPVRGLRGQARQLVGELDYQAALDEIDFPDVREVAQRVNPPFALAPRSFWSPASIALAIFLASVLIFTLLLVLI